MRPRPRGWGDERGAWAAAPTPLKLGATAPGTSVNIAARLAKVALGLPVQQVAGYRGTADIRLAVESGELDGVCFNWTSMRTSWRHALDGRVAVVLQFSPRPCPGWPTFPWPWISPGRTRLAG